MHEKIYGPAEGARIVLSLSCAGVCVSVFHTFYHDMFSGSMLLVAANQWHQHAVLHLPNTICSLKSWLHTIL
jgi:hypothetical protein